MAVDMGEITKDFDKDKIAELSQRTANLKESNAELQRQLHENEQDTNEFVQFFQQEIAKRDSELIELRETLKSLGTDGDRHFEEVRLKYSAELEEVRDKERKVQHELETKVEKASDDLQNLREFSQQRDKMEADLQSVKNKLKNAHERHERELAELLNKFDNERKRLAQRHESAVGEIKRQSLKEAQKSLDRKTRIAMINNDNKLEELKIQEEAAQELLTEVERLRKENEALQEQLRTSKQSTGHSASVGHRKSQQLREKDEVVHNLERSLREIVVEFEKERERSASEHSKQIDKMQHEIDSRKQLVKVKNKEIKNIRRLSKTILDQRSQVEHFFYQALKQVKQEMKKTKFVQFVKDQSNFNKQATHEKRKARTKFPSIRAANVGKPTSVLPKRPQNPMEQHVTLKDLSWADRERVLRLLFTKMNTAEAKQPPPARVRSPARTTARAQDSTFLTTASYSGQALPDMA